jgi:hypothetical protein
VEDHRELMVAAIERDGAAHRALFAGDVSAASSAFVEAAELYRRSWEAAPPASYGRLVGMLKSSVLARGGDEQARYVQAALGEEAEGSPVAAYAHALAALISGDDAAARSWSERMRAGSEAFVRTADAVDALAARDRDRFSAAQSEIVHDFERRSDHLTGVAIADTALMLDVLAARRGIDAALQSHVLPARTGRG